MTRPKSRHHTRMWGGAIRQRRERLGMTQESFAAAIVEASGGELGLDRTSVAKWEAGKFAPAVRYRPFIAQVLEVPYETLFQILPGEAA